MTGAPLVSVILPTRDRAGWVSGAIDSVLAQSHRPIELIVVDDGSRDHTPEVLERFGDEITVLSQRPAAGAYAARNLGVRHSSGEFVAFIDSDDSWHPGKLAAQLPLMEPPAVGLVFGDARHVAPGGADVSRTCFGVTPPRRGGVAPHFAAGNFVPTTTVLVRRSCFEEIGGFPLSHDLSADYVTWFRVALRHELDYVAEPVADYTVHEEGISHDLGRALVARIELFNAELEQTTDPAARAVLRRLVFNLGLHLGLAVPRGRARGVRHPWRIARRALGVAASRRVAPWTAEFFAREARIRMRRRAGLT